MNAGKSAILLQAAYNYRERGMTPLLLKPSTDTRGDDAAAITSRIGLRADAALFDADTDLFHFIRDQHGNATIDCVLLDEAQFLTEGQVWQLAEVADQLSIPVMTYGLRTDFQGQLFPGSRALLAIADELREIRTICWCGRKATMVLRLDGHGQPVREGDQVEIGGDERYISLCRRHWSRGQTAAS